MYENHEPRMSANETDPLGSGQMAGDEDLDFDGNEEPKEPTEDPPPTEYPGGGDGSDLPAPGSPEA